LSYALTVTVQLETHECRVCGITFAAPEEFWRQRHNDHSLAFHCPAGHGSCFAGETEAQKYKRLFEQEQQRLRLEKETNERQRRMLKTSTTKLTNLKKRVANGVCPCCKRTVSQMARHMASKHPGYEQQEVGP